MHSVVVVHDSALAVAAVQRTLEVLAWRVCVHAPVRVHVCVCVCVCLCVHAVVVRLWAARLWVVRLLVVRLCGW